jgi:hypothetical protein
MPPMAVIARSTCDEAIQSCFVGGFPDCRVTEPVIGPANPDPLAPRNDKHAGSSNLIRI